MSERDVHFIPLYAGPIHQATSSGDVQAMRTLAERAEREGGSDPEIVQAYGKLVAEIGRLEGRPWDPRVLYGVALQGARASGDVDLMRRLADRARTEGANDPAIQSALAALEAEIGQAGGGDKGHEYRPMYAGPIQDAIRSGDLQQMRDVQARAQREGGSDPDVQSALRELDQEIQRHRGA